MNQYTVQDKWKFCHWATSCTNLCMLGSLQRRALPVVRSFGLRKYLTAFTMEQESKRLRTDASSDAPAAQPATIAGDLSEVDVGATEFTTSTKGFFGILKQRY